MLVRTQFFLDMTLCWWVSDSRRFERIYCLLRRISSSPRRIILNRSSSRISFWSFLIVKFTGEPIDIFLAIYVPLNSWRVSNGFTIPTLVTVLNSLFWKFLSLLEMCFAAYPEAWATYISAGQISDSLLATDSFWLSWTDYKCDRIFCVCGLHSDLLLPEI